MHLNQNVCLFPMGVLKKSHNYGNFYVFRVPVSTHNFFFLFCFLNKCVNKIGYGSLLFSTLISFELDSDCHLLFSLSVQVHKHWEAPTVEILAFPKTCMKI